MNGNPRIQYGKGKDRCMEIFPFDGQGARIYVWPEKELLSLPECKEINKKELNAYIAGLNEACGILGWSWDDKDAKKGE